MNKFLIQIIFLLVSTYGAGKNIIELNKNHIGYIGKHHYYLEATSDSITVEKAYQLFKTGKFLKNNSKVFAKPVLKGKTWIAFKIQNKTDKQFWMNLTSSLPNKVLFYKIDSENKIVDQKISGSILGRENSYFNYNTFWFPLTQQQDKNEPYTIMLGIESASPREFPIEVGTLEKLHKTKFKNDIFRLLFLGAMFVIFLYNLVLSIITRDKLYLLYSLYVIAITVTASLVSNIPFLELLIGSYITNTYINLFITPAFLLVCLLTISFLKLSETLPVYHKILVAIVIFNVILAISNLFIPAIKLSNLVQLSALLTNVFCIIPSYILAIKGHSNAKVYSLGWSIMLVGALCQILVLNGFIEYNYVTKNITLVCIVLEVLVFSIAFAHRINDMKKEQVKLNKILTQKNNQLKESNESLDNFNYHVSHDLKTVLVNSFSLSKMVLKYTEKNNTKKVIDIAKRLINISENGLETVSSFLTLGRITGHTQPEESELIDIEQEIERVLSLHDLRSRVSFKITKNEIGQLYFNKKAFESVLLNFLTNTIKYSTNSPESTLEILDDKQSVTVIYSDKGIGIDLDKDGSKLFQPFQRITNNLKAEGSGVGLYLVKRIIEEYQGTIEAKSKLGEGTTFIINLPKINLQ